MPTEDDIKRLDGRIDGAVRDQQNIRESVAGIRVQVTSHEATLGKVNELEKGMVRLNAQVDGVKEDIGEVRTGQDKMLELFNEDRKAREQEKKARAEREEQDEKDAAKAKDERTDRNWTRLLQVAAILALVVVTLVAAYISTGRI